MVKDLTIAVAVRTTEHGNSGYILYMPNSSGNGRYGWYTTSHDTDHMIRQELQNDAEDYGRSLVICTPDRQAYYGIK